MFDAKSLLEALVTGGQRQAAPQAGGGGLGDLLGQVLGGAAGQQGRGAPAGGGGLGDLLGQVLGGGAGGGRAAAPQPQGGGGLEDLLRNMVPGAGGQGGQPQGGGGGLGDILGQLQKQLGGGQGGPAGSQGGGGIADILGQVLGQATQGVREGAGRINDATGAGDRMRDAVGQMSGKNPDELLAQLKDLIAKNQLGAGATLGGLGALVLGTKTGRSAAATAVKLGALALIGGLAYKAVQNYQSGRPMIGGNFVPEQAPQGSGFEPAAITNESAALYIRAMIAAAAADGRIDGAEQQKILGGLKQAGLDSAAEEFLANELNNPATAAELASAVSNEQEAVQVYTAARLAIEPDTRGEQAFLAELAGHLGMDQGLAGHIDATARSAAA